MVCLLVYHFPFDISVCKFKQKELCGEANITNQIFVSTLVPRWTKEKRKGRQGKGQNTQKPNSPHQNPTS